MTPYEYLQLHKECGYNCEFKRELDDTLEPATPARDMH